MQCFSADNDTVPRGGSRAGSLGGAQQLTGGGDSSRNLKFPLSAEAGPIQWGGGVGAEIFRGLQKPAQFPRYSH